MRLMHRGMSKDGAGNTHDLAIRLRYKEISGKETDCELVIAKKRYIEAPPSVQ
jgi:hypothetical protein